MNSFSQSSILIVDDLPDNLRLLRDTLKGQGYKVRSCTTGAMALRGAKAASIDLILLDVKLPDCDGYEVCQQLKTDQETAHIPVIFLSALTQTLDKIQGFAVGGADYITKPFQIEEVLARVEAHLSIQKLQKKLHEKNFLLTQEIEEHKRTQEALFFEKELAQVTLKSIGDAVITTDAKGCITSLNSMAENLTGWSQQEAEELPLFEVFKVVNEITKQPIEKPTLEAVEKIKAVNLAKNTILVARDGREYPIDKSAASIQDSQGEVMGAVIIFRDMTETRNFTRQLSWQASHDSLTGLLNRLAFQEKVEEAIISAKNEDKAHVLCYLDLDKFKVINDTCGHGAGDELLRQVTHLLQNQVRGSDILARLGGDEFACLLYQCSLENARLIANNFRQVIENFCFKWGHKIFKISVSIGLVRIDLNTKDLQSVLALADIACYAAKGRGKNCIEVYQADDEEILKQRQDKQWSVQINQALAENRFCLYTQKIVPIQVNNKPYYYEVLLRLLDNTGNLVSPDVFIPHGERYGLMPLIDRWVISHFLQHYDHYYQGNIPEIPITYALNISEASINHQGFLEFVKEQLAQVKIPPQTLCFEIRETTAIANFSKVIDFIEELKALGCCFALDNYGHGLDSFEYIKHLPVDYLKIDGSFVKNIINSEVDQAIVASFHHISQIMNLKTIAQLVENQPTLATLKTLGLDYAQGYAVSAPTPLNFEEINR